MIEIRQLEKKYQHQGLVQMALNKINLTIPKGIIFGIIGKSGAGKSTLLRCLNMLEKPSGGDILLHDVAINGLDDAQLRKVRRKMAMIFQHFNLLSSRNVFDNVALPMEIHGIAKDQIQQKVISLLKLVGLEDKAKAFPRQLSGGQKQRVAIARALVTDPEILLCDEATSALDPETTVAILDLLKKINQELGITIILITHEMDVIKQICHEVALLDQGELIEKNTVVDFFATPKTPLAKRLTGAALHIELPYTIANSLQSVPQAGYFPVVKLSFIGEASKKPLLSYLTQHYQVAANIFLADIETINNMTIGVTVCQLVGESNNVEAALAYLLENIQVEVLGYAR